MGLPVALGIGSMIVGAGAEMYSSYEQNQIRQQQIHERLLQTRLQANEKTIANQSKLQRVISTSRAEAGAAGFDPGDASFRAIENNDFNNFATDQRIDNLNERANIDSLNLESQQSSEAASIGELGAVTGLGMNLFASNSFTNYGNTNKGSLFDTLFKEA